MKKYLKLLLPIIILVAIFLLKDNHAYAATSSKGVMLNPAYENILDEEEKKIILQKLNQAEEIDDKTENNTYNDTVYTTYDGAAKAIQQNFVNRSEKFTVLYKAGTDTSFAKTILLDAIQKDYLHTSDSGDYLKYSMGGSAYEYKYQIINSKEVLYYLTFTPHYYTTYS